MVFFVVFLEIKKHQWIASLKMTSSYCWVISRINFVQNFSEGNHSDTSTRGQSRRAAFPCLT